MTSFYEDRERARTIAGQALRHIEDLEAPPNPRNYTLLYAYHGNHDRNLIQALDALPSDPAQRARMLEDLFDRHFGLGREGTQVTDTARSLREVVDRLAGTTAGFGADAASYGRALDAAADSLDSLPPQIAVTLASLAAETRRMAQRNEELRSELDRSAAEVSRLTDDLEAVRREAMTDGLTGLANRKFFDIEIRRAAELAEANGHPLSLLMLDIDHFKRFNDTYGHQIGDQVIRLVGRTLLQCVRGSDLAARYGGEEFAVVLPDTTLDNALALAEAIRKTVAARHLVSKSRSETLGQVTLSVGASLFCPGEPVGDLLRRSDEALYDAKRGGRNTVRFRTHGAVAAAA